MLNKPLRTLLILLAAGLLLFFLSAQRSSADDTIDPPSDMAQSAAAANPIFRFPVVPGATISGYFDHNPGDNWLTFYDGRYNKSSGYGFYFQCSNPSMYDWVGCEDNVTGESACANNRELWYDGHKGTDYEFSSAWHTGATCNPGKFGNLTMPIYAPAKGRVTFVGYNHQFNGNHMFIVHDANGNGNLYDDTLRAAYLHFASLNVTQGQIVEEGYLLGYGGSTGYSSSPHLHFEVQRASSTGFTDRWSVDPYGWQGAGTDPWPYQNDILWKYPPSLKNKNYIPSLAKGPDACVDCDLLIKNGGFESGRANWIEQGVDIIVNTSYSSLVQPHSGSWLAWLAGRNSATDWVSQNFTVPQNASTATLEYYVKLSTEENDGVVHDAMPVRLRAADCSTLIRDVDYIDDNFLPRDQWTRRTVSLGDLSAYRGQSLCISFKGGTDATLKSSFFVDDVSIRP